MNNQPECSHSTRTDLLFDDDDMDSNTFAESDMSLKSGTFCWTNLFKRCNTRQQQKFLNMGNVVVLDNRSICFHGNGILRKFTLHQKYREQSHNEAGVRHIWGVDCRQSDDLWSEHN